MDSPPLLPIPQLLGQSTNPITAYQQLITASPTQKPNQPLLIIASAGISVVVTTELLTNALKAMLHGLGVDSNLVSLHSLCRQPTMLVQMFQMRRGMVTRAVRWLSGATLLSHSSYTAQCVQSWSDMWPHFHHSSSLPHWVHTHRLGGRDFSWNVMFNSVLCYSLTASCNHK